VNEDAMPRVSWHEHTTKPVDAPLRISCVPLLLQDQGWGDKNSWGSGGAKKSPPGKGAATPPRARPPSGGRPGMPRTNSASSSKSAVRAHAHQSTFRRCRFVFVVKILIMCWTALHQSRCSTAQQEDMQLSVGVFLQSLLVVQLSRVILWLDLQGAKNGDEWTGWDNGAAEEEKTSKVQDDWGKW